MDLSVSILAVEQDCSSLLLHISRKLFTGGACTLSHWGRPFRSQPCFLSTSDTRWPASSSYAVMYPWDVSRRTLLSQAVLSPQ